jgi:hypothetical protein
MGLENEHPIIILNSSECFWPFGLCRGRPAKEVEEGREISGRIRPSLKGGIFFAACLLFGSIMRNAVEKMPLDKQQVRVSTEGFRVS